MKLGDAIERMGVAGDGRPPGRRAQFRPAREAIDLQKRDDRKRMNGMAQPNGEAMARPPSLLSFLVRVRAVQQAFRHRDGDAMRGELINLSSFCEVWAEKMRANHRIREGYAPVWDDLAPPDEEFDRVMREAA